MKKKLTLEKAWTECLRMWKWVAKHHDEYVDINEAKLQWLYDNGYERFDVACRCFFCEYAGGPSMCRQCPGELVDRSFDCDNPSYHHRIKPKAFYKKLVELNKIRRAK